MKKAGFFLIILYGFLLTSLAAQDTLLRSTNDTLISIQTDTFQLNTKTHSPARAAMLSAAFPGLGQIYNKKYWKVPIIYAGSATLCWFINSNNSRYIFWREVYYEAKILERKSDEFINWYYERYPNGNADNYTVEDILNKSESWKESYRKYRDYCIIGLAALYLVNIIDANVDAFFLNFDVSEDLTLRIKPYVDKSLLSENIIGVKLSLDYK